MTSSVYSWTVEACFSYREIGIHALRHEKSAESSILTCIRLIQHPTYDPILFMEALCVMPLLIYTFGLRGRLTIDFQYLIVHCRFADLNV
jgi:hypothetical protein